MFDIVASHRFSLIHFGKNKNNKKINESLETKHRIIIIRNAKQRAKEVNCSVQQFIIKMGSNSPATKALY